jgi:hypothetical protein
MTSDCRVWDVTLQTCVLRLLLGKVISGSQALPRVPAVGGGGVKRFARYLRTYSTRLVRDSSAADGTARKSDHAELI